MKQLTLFTICSFAVLVGCEQFFKDKNELLTSGKWLIYEKTTFGSSNGETKIKMEFFKKGDESLVFTFHKYGELNIRESGKPAALTVLWEWKGDDRLKITRGDEFKEYKVARLGSKTLELRLFDAETFDSETMIFKHPDFKDWHSDERVDMMNSIARE